MAYEKTKEQLANPLDSGQEERGNAKTLYRGLLSSLQKGDLASSLLGVLQPFLTHILDYIHRLTL